jgi:hypothetical protein
LPLDPEWLAYLIAAPDRKPAILLQNRVNPPPEYCLQEQVDPQSVLELEDPALEGVPGLRLRLQS